MKVHDQSMSPWPFIGIGGMACAFFLYAAAWPLAPWWVVVPMLLVWLVLLVQSLRWWTPRPTWVPAVAGFAIALWFLVYLGGGILFRW